jgi:hypothetical protein
MQRQKRLRADGGLGGADHVEGRDFRAASDGDGEHVDGRIRKVVRYGVRGYAGETREAIEPIELDVQQSPGSLPISPRPPPALPGFEPLPTRGQ